MEVGQDQVTLRTGKQANRRNCQFVLQALLALFGNLYIIYYTLWSINNMYYISDTQEAPKSLGLDSSSSTESLNEESRSDKTASGSIQPNTQTQRSVSPVGTVKSLNLSRPPLPFRRAPIISSGSAFTSYVRRRGEPDGGRTESEATGQLPLNNTHDTSQANTTDSELSDGYTSQTLNKFELKPKMGYSSLRGPVKVSRPGGGGESDAAFTPSPPVAVDSNVSLALAHQTRIRNLYSGATAAFAATEVGIRDLQIHNARRPDSSSSASSTTDWEGSGHATVLRRANQNHQVLPPLPPPRQTLPLVDSLRPLAPLAPVYNNLGLSNTVSGAPTVVGGNGLESTSSDSEFERGFDIPASSSMLRGRGKLKPLQQFLSRKISDQIDFMDRLSVRTELTSTQVSIAQPTSTPRKPPITMPDDDNPLSFNANNLYFSPAETEAIETKKETTKASSKEHKVGTHNKNIQDSIMRHMNREMTPTISEVYHERNLGLGLAPPLSKLLLSKNYEETDNKLGNSINIKDSVSSDMDLAVSNTIAVTASVSITNAATNTHSSNGGGDTCNICNSPAEILCSCKTGTTIKKMSSKPWLSNVIPNIIKASDLTTADILERQNKIKGHNVSCVSGSDSSSSTLSATNVNNSNTNNGNNSSGNNTSKRVPGGNSSPFSDLSRRDEGDGRSVADSQCSGNYKVDVNAVQQQIRNKFNI